MASIASGCPCILPFFFLLGLLIIYDGTMKYLFMQKVKNIPTSKVRSAAVGLVELFGKARCMDNMPSPVDKTKCVYWKIHAQWYQSGKHGGWRNLYLKQSSNQFYLEDDTGKLLIDPTNAQIEIPRDQIYSGYIPGKGFFGMSHKKIDQRVLDFIETLSEKDKKTFMNMNKVNVRVMEYYIAENDKIYVLGNAEIRDSVKSATGHENLIIKLSPMEKVMYISDSHEKKVIEKLQFDVLWRLAIGILLSTGCLFFLLAGFL